MKLEQKIISAIENHRFKLVEGKRKWFSYVVDIQELIWARNLRDGYDIHIYNQDEKYLTTIKI